MVILLVVESRCIMHDMGPFLAIPESPAAAEFLNRGYCTWRGVLAGHVQVLVNDRFQQCAFFVHGTASGSK